MPKLNPPKKPSVTYISGSEPETMKIAAELARSVKAPVFICLRGNLGAGKTVFAKGFAHGLGIDAKRIKSPTYTFVREYKVKRNKLYHFDFYRIEDLDDLMSETLREIFEKKNAIILMEWPEHVSRILPEGSKEVRIEYVDETTRKITVSDD
jgi:tRNA threonylcarbamoyladenosine biosynthesis protein TsaE